MEKYSKKNFLAIAQSLNKDEDWEERMKAMAALQALSQTSDEKEIASFVAGFDTSVQKALVHQLRDLRSQIFREACKTVSVIITKLGAQTTSFVYLALPVLFAGLQNTKQVFSQSSHQCILSIIKHVPFHIVIVKLIEASSSQHPSVRAKCAGYIWMSLHTTQKEEIEKSGHLPIVENEIVVRLADGNPEVRKLSRKSFAEIRNRWPSHAERMLNMMDIPTRKQLEAAEKIGIETSSDFASPKAQSLAEPAQRSPNTAAVQPLKPSNTPSRLPPSRDIPTTTKLSEQKSTGDDAKSSTKQRTTFAQFKQALRQRPREARDFIQVMDAATPVPAASTPKATEPSRPSIITPELSFSPIRSVTVLPPQSAVDTDDFLSSSTPSKTSLVRDLFKNDVQALDQDEPSITVSSKENVAPMLACEESAAPSATEPASLEEFQIESSQEFVVEPNAAKELPTSTVLASISEDNENADFGTTAPVSNTQQRWQALVTSFLPILSPVKESDLERSDVTVDSRENTSQLSIAEIAESLQTFPDDNDDGDSDDELNRTQWEHDMTREEAQALAHAEQLRRVAEFSALAESRSPFAHSASEARAHAHRLAKEQQLALVKAWQQLPAEEHVELDWVSLAEEARQWRIAEDAQIPYEIHDDALAVARMIEQEREERVNDEAVQVAASLSALEITSLVEQERARRLDSEAVRVEVNMTPTKITAMVEAERAQRVADEGIRVEVNATPKSIGAAVERERSARIENERVVEEHTLSPYKITALVEQERQRRVAEERVTVEQETPSKSRVLEEQERRERLESDQVSVEPTWSPSRISAEIEKERDERIRAERIHWERNLSPAKINALVEQERQDRLLSLGPAWESDFTPALLEAVDRERVEVSTAGAVRVEMNLSAERIEELVEAERADRIADEALLEVHDTPSKIRAAEEVAREELLARLDERKRLLMEQHARVQAEGAEDEDAEALVAEIVEVEEAIDALIVDECFELPPDDDEAACTLVDEPTIDAAHLDTSISSLLSERVELEEVTLQSTAHEYQHLNSATDNATQSQEQLQVEVQELQSSEGHAQQEQLSETKESQDVTEHDSIDDQEPQPTTESALEEAHADSDMEKMEVKSAAETETPELSVHQSEQDASQSLEYETHKEVREVLAEPTLDSEAVAEQGCQESLSEREHRAMEEAQVIQEEQTLLQVEDDDSTHKSKDVQDFTESSELEEPVAQAPDSQINVDQADEGQRPKRGTRAKKSAPRTTRSARVAPEQVEETTPLPQPDEKMGHEEELEKIEEEEVAAAEEEQQPQRDEASQAVPKRRGRPRKAEQTVEESVPTRSTRARKVIPDADTKDKAAEIAASEPIATRRGKRRVAEEVEQTSVSEEKSVSQEAEPKTRRRGQTAKAAVVTNDSEIEAAPKTAKPKRGMKPVEGADIKENVANARTLRSRGAKLSAVETSAPSKASKTSRK